MTKLVLLSFALFVLSCSTKHNPKINKTDSVWLLVRYLNGSFLLDTAVRHIETKQIIDSNEKVVSRIDTTYFVKQNVEDKDSTGKTILDSLKHPKMHRDWFNYAIPDSIRQLITIPHSPFNDHKTTHL